MFNAQFARLASAVIVGLSDKDLPCGTADHALNAMCNAEIAFEVEKVKNRLECEAHRVMEFVRNGVPLRPSPKVVPHDVHRDGLIPTHDEWNNANERRSYNR